MKTATQATWENVRELNHQLTMIFIGGRYPSNSDLIRADELRGEITRMENELNRKYIDSLKS